MPTWIGSNNFNLFWVRVLWSIWCDFFYTEYKALLASSGAPAHWAFCGAIVERLIIRSTGFAVEKNRACLDCLLVILRSHQWGEGKLSGTYSSLTPKTVSTPRLPSCIQIRRSHAGLLVFTEEAASANRLRSLGCVVSRCCEWVGWVA